MMEARILGNYVQHLSQEKGLSILDLSRILECSEHQVNCLFKGRAFATYPQMSKLAAAFDTTVEALLKGNIDEYNATVVHCMNGFQNEENREKILDIIDGYIDIVDAISLNNEG